MIFASSRPLTLVQIEQLFRQSGYSLERTVLKSCIEVLQRACDARAIELVEVASGFEYRVKTDFSPWLAHMTEERPQRYSRALLETLALIVYRQPITRAEIEEVRGVAVSSTILRTLLEREWIKEVGYKDVPGRPMLFATTRLFLDYFGLKNLCDLPPLEDFTHLDNVGTQLEKMLHETENTTTK
ncbi:MAG: SMC-Scp complex subunit ScpB [Gammaproteobacteria bacterium]|nr:SMC-Scp complex subunit ScpB [Gammaproteobacteria bacterium]